MGACHRSRLFVKLLSTVDQWGLILLLLDLFRLRRDDLLCVGFLQFSLTASRDNGIVHGPVSSVLRSLPTGPVSRMGLSIFVGLEGLRDVGGTSTFRRQTAQIFIAPIQLIHSPNKPSKARLLLLYNQAELIHGV